MKSFRDTDQECFTMYLLRIVYHDYVYLACVIVLFKYFIKEAREKEVQMGPKESSNTNTMIFIREREKESKGSCSLKPVKINYSTVVYNGFKQKVR